MDGILAAADHGEPGGDAAVGDRDAGVGWGSDGRGHAGYHLEGNAVTCKGKGLLAAAAKDEGVAALEARHAQASLRFLDKQGVDAVLGQLLLSSRLAGEDALGGGGRVVQQRRVGQPVVDDDVGPLQRLAALDSQQPGVTRARADEIDLSGLRVHSGVFLPRVSASEFRDTLEDLLDVLLDLA